VIERAEVQQANVGIRLEVGRPVEVRARVEAAPPAGREIVEERRLRIDEARERPVMPGIEIRADDLGLDGVERLGRRRPRRAARPCRARLGMSFEGIARQSGGLEVLVLVVQRREVGGRIAAFAEQLYEIRIQGAAAVIADIGLLRGVVFGVEQFSDAA